MIPKTKVHFGTGARFRVEGLGFGGLGFFGFRGLGFRVEGQVRVEGVWFRDTWTLQIKLGK